VVTPRPSSLSTEAHQIRGQRNSSQIMGKYNWDWKPLQRSRYNESISTSRPKSESEILRYDMITLESKIINTFNLNSSLQSS
jgi:hypothetical protein